MALITIPCLVICLFFWRRSWNDSQAIEEIDDNKTTVSYPGMEPGSAGKRWSAEETHILAYLILYNESRIEDANIEQTLQVLANIFERSTCSIKTKFSRLRNIENNRHKLSKLDIETFKGVKKMSRAEAEEGFEKSIHDLIFDISPRV